MVRISKLSEQVKRSIHGNLRRVYPLVAGPSSWGDLPMKRSDYHERLFPLVQTPLIEATPQYKVGENSKPSELEHFAEGGNKERIRGLGQILQTAKENYDWDLYPHQKEAVIGHLEGKDVVVATGTGSGKTEAFMFPIVTHLNDEAIRSNEEGSESERAIKALVLYPMNALVADQMARLRNLLGDSQVAIRIMKNGFGRFPQFGMYTGRTEFHGWYSSKQEVDGSDVWSRKKKTEPKMNRLVKNFEAVRNRQSAWKELLAKGKVPSIGGQIVEWDEVGEFLQYDDLPPRAKKEVESAFGGKKAAKVRKYKIIDGEHVFDRFNSSDLDYGHDHARWVGESIDRELISRHQMHHGGLNQYIQYKQDNRKAGTSRNPSDAQSISGTGVPDVMVTNYSMLEYMLMRPIEHIFWHNTSKWLNGCDRPSEDPLRRRLLLVIDEAHLYQGAMGTEFSQLLNRLLAVLEVKRDRLQFIITSASLGKDEEEARRYASSLLSLEGPESSERKSRIVIPDAELIDIEEVDGIDDYLSEDCIAALSEASSTLNLGISTDGETISRRQVEVELLSKMFQTDCQERLDELVSSGFDEKTAHEDLCYSLISNSGWGLRLARLLLKPEQLDAESKSKIKEYYEDQGIMDVVHDPLASFPRRLDIVCQHMFGRNDDSALSSLDVLLDLVASARRKDGKPFLPLRAHILVRGNGISRICSRCGTIVPEGQDYCNHGEGSCGCLTYELYLERNCGGSFMVLWLDVFGSNVGFEWASQENSLPKRREISPASRAYQHRHRNPTTTNERLLGVLAKVCDSRDNATHVLNCRSGSIRRIGDANLGDDESYVQIANFNPDGEYEPGSFTVKKWESQSGITEFRYCPYCHADYRRKQSPQFSNTQTRGDEYFSRLVIESLSIQDPDPDSNHPHQGRKLMIFSDGRQQAARLARQLSEGVAMDEGRALLLYLLRQDWFSRIPREKKSLHHLYPYFCTLSGAMSVNPLSDSTGNPDRTRMLSHISSLASWVLISLKDKDEKMGELHSDIFPSEETAESHINKFVWRKLSWIIRSVKKYDLNEGQDALEDKASIKILDDLKERWESEYFLNSVGNAKFYDGRRALSEYDGEAQGTPAHFKIRLLRKRCENDKFLECMSIQSTILEDEEVGHLAISREVFSRLIEILENNDPSLSEEIPEIFSKWMKEVLPHSPTPIPPTFGSSLIRWLFDDLFGTVSLGMTWGELIMDKKDEEILSKEVADKLSQVLPAILLDISPMEVSGGTSSRRILCGIDSTYGTGDVEVITSKSYYLSHENTNVRTEGIKVSTNHGVLEVSDALSQWLEDHCPDLDQFSNEIEQWLGERHSSFFVKNTVANDATQERWSLRSDRYHITPWEGGILDDIRMCENCYLPRCGTATLNCLNCGSDSFHSPEDGTLAKSYFDERLRIWRERVSQIESDFKHGSLRIYRSEEHTAQISKKLDDEELYSMTEAHELQFQDIPIKSRALSEDLSIEQPPIDILSCTTTMEVGIDIGSLTAVALRTVPPHAANYQQRVGRAGRGKSEVSLALTWIDNSAYAQSHFETPERLVTHPSEAPNIYLKNQRILERHLNALCFQLFFKNRDYDPVSLRFDGMEPGIGNLLESLGYAEDFFHDSRPPYGVSDMISWLDQVQDGSGSNENKKRVISQATGLSPDEIKSGIDLLKKRLETWKEEYER